MYSVLVCTHCSRFVYSTAHIAIPEDIKILYPTVRTEASNDYPEEVRDNLTESIRSFSGNNYKASVIMARSALQSAMREMSANGKNLYEEIEDLASKHLIPIALSSWAHEIRDGGNLVAHPEPGKKVQREDAAELLALTESILEYMYLIPADVKRRRDRLSSHP